MAEIFTLVQPHERRGEELMIGFLSSLFARVAGGKKPVSESFEIGSIAFTRALEASFDALRQHSGLLSENDRKVVRVVLQVAEDAHGSFEGLLSRLATRLPHHIALVEGKRFLFPRNACPSCGKCFTRPSFEEVMNTALQSFLSVYAGCVAMRNRL